MGKFYKYVLPAVLLFGLCLRLISLNQSLWLDEASTALAAKMSLVNLFGKFLPGDFHPPLYYLLMYYWIRLFGYSEVSLRVPSIIFGIGLTYLIYLLGTRLANKKVGLISALLSATSGLLIYYSQEARMYSMASFFVALCFFWFLKILKEGRLGDYILFSIFITLAVFTDYMAILILPVFFIYAILSKQNKTWWKKLFMSHIILGVSIVFWLPIFIKQLTLGLNVGTVSPGWWQILGQTSIKNILLIPTKFVLGRISFDNKLLYAAITVFTVSMFGYLCLRTLKALKNTYLIWLWINIPAIAAILLGLFVPVLYYFRLLFVLPGFYILASYGIKTFKKPMLQITLLVVILINLLSSAYYLFNPKFHREDWRGLAKEIGSEKIVFPADSQKEVLIYYGKGAQIVKTSELGISDKEIWLSRYLWEIVDPTDSSRKNLAMLGYNKTGEYNFNGVVVWKYNK